MACKGISVHGFCSARSPGWSRIAAVDLLGLRPTAFLVVRTAPSLRMPALSPLRRLFARAMGVVDPASLLVVRTKDSPFRHEAIEESVRRFGPAGVPVGGPWRAR